MTVSNTKCKSVVKDWDKLNICPFNLNYGTIHHGFTDGEFMVVSCVQDEDASSISEIHIFNSRKSTWNKYKFVPTNITYHTAALNRKHKILYICDMEYLYKVNFNTFTSEIFQTNFYADFVTVINNRCHVLEDSHLVWNDSTYKFDEQANDVGCGCYDPAAMIYLQSKKCVLQIGGTVTVEASVPVDYIYSYDIKNKVSNRLELQLPKRVSELGCAITHDERFVIIFCGARQNHRDIFVLDTTKMTIMKKKKKKKKQTKKFIMTSKIRVPLADKFYPIAIIPHSKTVDEITCFGYLRQMWKRDEFKYMIYPTCLMQLVSLFYENSYVHLINAADGECGHFTIQVDKILDCY
eukprot:117838_1